MNTRRPCSSQRWRFPAAPAAAAARGWLVRVAFSMLMAVAVFNVRLEGVWSLLPAGARLGFRLRRRPMEPDAMAVTHSSTPRILSAIAIFIKFDMAWRGFPELSHSTSSGLPQSLLPTDQSSSFIGMTYSSSLCSPLLDVGSNRLRQSGNHCSNRALEL
jgi:hypothetical protein